MNVFCKRKRKKALSFLLTLALILAGAGTAVRLDGLFSIKAKADAVLNHSVTAGTVYKIGSHNYVAAQTGDSTVMFIAQDPSASTYLFHEFNSSGNEITSPTTTNSDLDVIADDLEMAGLTPKLSTWEYSEQVYYTDPISEVSRQGFYGVPTQEQVNAAVSGLSDVSGWTSTLKGQDDKAYYLNNGAITSHYKYDYQKALLAFYLDLSKDVHIYTLDGETTPVIEFAVLINATNFPDENFRNDLLESEADFADQHISPFVADGILTAGEIGGWEYYNIDNANISDLTGIRYLTAFKNLCCSDNQLTDLDVSKNTMLETLECSGNQLTELDLSNNTALTRLDCRNNALSSLDLSNNPALRELWCDSNQLTSLDVSNNTALEQLGCASNPLKNLKFKYGVDGATVTVSNGNRGSFNVVESFPYGIYFSTKTITLADPTTTDPAYTFDHWEVTGEGTTQRALTGGTTQFDFGSEDATITAVWVDSPGYRDGVRTYDLTINEVYQNPDGTEERTVTNTVTYNVNETATITKTAPEGYSIVGDAEQTVTMTSAKTMTFIYKKNAYDLTINEVYLNYDGTENHTSTSTETYAHGETATVTKSAPNGYTLVGEGTQSVVMTSANTMTFTYRKSTPETYDLTINEVYQNPDGTEERTVISSEAYNEGETATITKTAPTGYTLIGESTQSVVMDDDKELTFTYKKNTYTLTINEIYQNTDGSEERTTTDTATYAYGETAMVTKTAPSGYSIVGEATQSIVIDSAKSMTFTYRKNAPNTYTLTINEVYQDENGDEERTVTSTETYTAGTEATVAKSAPEGYTLIGEGTQTVTMDSAKTMTFTYKKNATTPPTPPTDPEISDYVTITSRLKMRWQGLSGESVTKKIGNITVTLGSKKIGRFAGIALITVDPTTLADGKSITVSIPNRHINLTIGGVTVAATVDLFDGDEIVDSVTLTNASGSRQLVASVVTDSSDLPYDDFFGKSITGNVEVSVTFS